MHAPLTRQTHNETVTLTHNVRERHIDILSSCEFDRHTDMLSSCEFDRHTDMLSSCEFDRHIYMLSSSSCESYTYTSTCCLMISSHDDIIIVLLDFECQIALYHGWHACSLTRPACTLL